MLANRIHAPHAALWGVLLVLSALLIFAIPAPLTLVFRFPWMVFEAKGSIHVISLAVVATLIYWLVLPRNWHMFGLLLISLFVPLMLGASGTFVILIIVLALATLTAARQPVETSDSPPLANINFLYVIFFTTILSLAAVNVAILEVPAMAVVTAGATTLALVLAALRPAHPFPVPEITPAKGIIVIYLVVGLMMEAQSLQTLLPRAVELYGLFAVVATLPAIRSKTLRRLLGKAVIIFLLISLIILKRPATLSIEIVGWIGFSYIAFRLMSVILDSFNGQYTDASRPEILLYTLFFPALLVGPIDRLPRFLRDRRADSQSFDWTFAVEGTLRILRGCAKKFFLADALLAPVALGVSTPPASNTAFAWLQLYAYAFYIFFDFSGYVDIALGSAHLLGYKLPENFNTPYLKSNIAEFWQSWHITLSNWLRTYVFIPMSRRLMQSGLRRWPLLTVFAAQIVTMVLIGLWHGITLNFAVWGAWHGIGLFLYKVYSDRTRRYYLRWKQVYPLRTRILSAAGVILTFHFVLLGWVFFALPNMQNARRFFAVLFGGQP
jgi:alginate O-acetyltransferase complex protein AlgI